MLIWNPSKLTTKGKALLAKAQAGRCTIKITKAQTGSGQYSSGEATDTRTSLKAPVQTLPIHSKEIQNGSTLVLKVAITNKTSDTDVLKSGYEIREFGIFAQDPDDGEILYSIATASTSDYMPAYNGVIPSVISMSYYLEVANASRVTIVPAGGAAERPGSTGRQSNHHLTGSREEIRSQEESRPAELRRRELGETRWSCRPYSQGSSRNRRRPERLHEVGISIQCLQTVQPFRRQKSHRIPGRRQLFLDRR